MIFDVPFDDFCVSRLLRREEDSYEANERICIQILHNLGILLTKLDFNATQLSIALK